MHVLSILFFCAAASSDSFIIGLSYGSKGIRIRFCSNFLVASISSLGTFLAMLLGLGIYEGISYKYTTILGSIILILFGFYMLISSLKKKDSKENLGYQDYINHPEHFDKDRSKEIELKEAVILGAILSINNIGIGIGASTAGLNIIITSFLSLLFSMVFVKLGFYIGKKITSSRLSKYIEYISALIIIFLGLYQLLVG
ncbi:putative sporulation protein YtaF [Clostridium sp. N3C]|uniref:sporulation membrane protein YtaF n=1 Tax=Clostridium sp. N3C TaxID=1776758 RepID=UPI00092DF1FD|nr:sporulation membrane protein YtaF [Clostridium sp. N3C]SCN25282.1 putative sporulation protein YtaF [Clostridium sp. N3C]